jgi:hypothetical protein
MFRNRSDSTTVIVGVFVYASDARRALNILHDHQFTSSEVEAAFRALALDKESPEENGRGDVKWFGQLRQIYRANNSLENRRQPRCGGSRGKNCRR